jgi:hypothetical protein
VNGISAMSGLPPALRAFASFSRFRRILRHFSSIASFSCRNALLSLAHLAASHLAPAGARLISFADVIEIKGAAAASSTKEKESKDAELAMLQVCFYIPRHFICPKSPLCHNHMYFQATFGTIPSNSSRIKMPSPVSSLLSLTGTEGANVILRSFHENLHMKPAFNRHHNFSQCSLLQGQAAPTSRVAAAKRIGGGYDKGKPGDFMNRLARGC